MSCHHGKLDGCAVCEEIEQLHARIATLQAARKLEHIAVQTFGENAPLRSRIKAYLDQLPPHVAQRQAAQLLKEAYLELGTKEQPDAR